MRKMVLRVVITFICLVLFTQPVYAAAVKVVIDPGHGGSDPGAIGVNGLKEKDVNLDIALKLNDELIRRGYETAMTRTTDVYLSLSERVEFKEQHNADLFVSIHANAFNNPNVKGSLILYYDNRYPKAQYPADPEMAALTPESKKFAQVVLEELVSAVHTENRGLMPSSVYVVRHGTMPSILVETAFLTNWDDAQLLADEQERLKMAIGIANGIEKYMPPSNKSLLKDIFGHWAQDAIISLYEQEIVRGENGRYYPDRPLTRAEFLAMLDRVFDFESLGKSDENSTDDQPSSETQHDDTNQEPLVPNDVDPSHWAYPMIQKAILHNVIQGYPDGTIRPNDQITRAEVSVLIDRVWNPNQPEIPSLEDLFEDVPENQWFTHAVYRLKALNLIQGYSDNKFQPHRSMTRAEIAVILDRFLNLYRDAFIEQN